MEPERFSELDEASLSDEQRRVRADILAGPRAGMRGPFKALLRSPGLFDTAQKLGAHIRFRSSLPRALNELAILLTARHWTAQFEWYAHHKLALEAGLPRTVAAAIAEGRRPEGMSEEAAAVHDFVRSLLGTGAVTDAQFAAVRERFGEVGVVDLIGAVGYYSLVSMVLNVDRLQVPGGELPLKPLR
jgi:4-carboxymuconolactone decarboxylase